MVSAPAMASAAGTDSVPYAARSAAAAPTPLITDADDLVLAYAPTPPPPMRRA